ncbi:uncharacterized protein LOC108151553 [Drosophila miranda]|uniref:Uncharacterized protein n=1 Tax=Drosophila pseudoobscura pseudoobscura TaxID=46245 RepID=Q2M009_DROPS|nr:uncharacterized protein LOC4813572 [Drosophila pseudoobscura]XP_017135709.1 uncharacterized protein LOC108151553 [Drosophila miranda]XP_026848575.1 uncharacterized protein LOC113566571 [Drosophila persimilis]
MNINIVLALFVVLCLTLISGQRDDCEALRRACETCSSSLNNPSDRNLPTLNAECRRKTRNTWIWRNVNRCELTRLNCIGSNRRMNCADIAELARMQRVRT